MEWLEYKEYEVGFSADASSGCVMNMGDIYHFIRRPFGNTEDNEEDEMNLYKVYLIDTDKCLFIQSDTVIARSEEKAALKIDLTAAMKNDLDEGKLDLIVNQIGSFTRYTKRVKVVE